MSESKKELIELIKRQTNYSEEIILEKLEKHENNIEAIILEYNGVKPIKDEKEITTNQKIFKAIRENMSEILSNNNSKK
tara:strand:- start:27 stop:263 length:237 start_codon:yes stop_codon:yes gene_type:complete